MSENIKTRKYYRVHNGTDWDRMHFVTDANSVDANDGDTMETKVGAIKGITTSTNVTEEGYAADATTVAALNDSLGGLEFTIVDGQPQWKERGADTFNPFSGGKVYYLGTGASGNISSLVKDVSKYSSSNFISFMQNASANTVRSSQELSSQRTDISGYSGVSVTYNNTTGAWTRTSPTYSATSSSQNGHYPLGISATNYVYKTYFIDGDIANE